MDSFNALKVLLYEFLSFEEARIDERLEGSCLNMIENRSNPEYVLEYYAEVAKAEEFTRIQFRLYEMLRYF